MERIGERRWKYICVRGVVSIGLCGVKQTDYMGQGRRTLLLERQGVRTLQPSSVVAVQHTASNNTSMYYRNTRAQVSVKSIKNEVPK